MADRAHAAQYAALLARTKEATGEPEADFIRRQVAMIGDSEPLLRVIVIVDGRRYELADLPAILDTLLADDVAPEPHLSFAYYRNRTELGRVRRLVAEGRRLAQVAQLDDAISRFEEAASVDRYDPMPVYDLGTARLVQRRYADARELFARTELLAPGFKLCRRLEWLADGLDSGRLDTRLPDSLLFQTREPAARRLDRADDLIASGAGIGWVHLDRGELLDQVGGGDEVMAAYRRGLTAEADPDVRSTLLIRVAERLPTGSERHELLAEALAGPGNLLDQARAQLLARRDFLWAGPAT